MKLFFIYFLFLSSLNVAQAKDNEKIPGLKERKLYGAETKDASEVCLLASCFGPNNKYVLELAEKLPQQGPQILQGVWKILETDKEECIESIYTSNCPKIPSGILKIENFLLTENKENVALNLMIDERTVSFELKLLLNGKLYRIFDETKEL